MVKHVCAINEMDGVFDIINSSEQFFVVLNKKFGISIITEINMIF